ncbi:hypothetical protein ElyMa_000254700 [Elysia marginata]|uniref:Secreted protein n=1 Tax=Elysia marginata TaxID=1093978 RepID=A0AAV4F416_9GAST|nr:hypothetical protein ElyMa_000254700 [Elysia marginata]
MPERNETIFALTLTLIVTAYSCRQEALLLQLRLEENRTDSVAICIINGRWRQTLASLQGGNPCFSSTTDTITRAIEESDITEDRVHVQPQTRSSNECGFCTQESETPTPTPSTLKKRRLTIIVKQY